MTSFLKRASLAGFVGLGLFAICAPLLWGVLLSFKTRVDALSMPPNWVFVPTLQNYRDAFLSGPYSRTLLNSLLIATVSSILALGVGAPAAYTFSRVPFRSRQTLLLSVLAVRMAPATVVALPLFIMFSRIGMIDSYAAVILVHAGINTSFVVWIAAEHMKTIPKAIDDAATLDGDGQWGILIRQILPIAAPGLAVAFFFCFINSWNEFFLGLMLTGYNTRPFTVAIAGLITPHGTNWGQLTAVSTVGILPGILFGLAARKYVLGDLARKWAWR